MWKSQKRKAVSFITKLLSHVTAGTTSLCIPLMGSIVNRVCGDIQVPYTTRRISLLHTEVDMNEYISGIYGSLNNSAVKRK
jgi:hypothetical protein